MTESEKKNYSEKYKGTNNPRFGKKMSIEQKEKMSKKIKQNWIDGLYDQGKEQRLLNLKKSNENKKRKVEQYNIEGELINIYPSISDISKFLNVTPGAISKCCNKRIRTCKGFILKFLN